jgi:hypothetical protein
MLLQDRSVPMMSMAAVDFVAAACNCGQLECVAATTPLSLCHKSCDLRQS